jgi:hypothetical protein
VDEKQAQLGWEERTGRLAAFACLASAALIVAAFAYRIGVLPRGANNAKEFLPQVEAHNGAFLVAGILTGLGMLAFIAPLLYLYKVTRFRRPEIPSVARVLVIFGPILFAICSVWLVFRQGHAADQFAAGTVKTNKHAEDLLRAATTAVAALSLAAGIATGLGTILLSMHAMRAGLLSRFMGILGVILGVLFVLPLIASPIIQLFWMLALGALFLNFWPSGRGPAWETGEATPWPTAQGPLRAAAEDQEPDDEPEPVPAPASPGASRKRRKKKARR